MPTVKHTGLTQWLGKSGNSVPGFVLCAGEDYLVQKAVDQINTRIMETAPSGCLLESLDGRMTAMGDVIEQVNTFSFFGGKLVLVRHSPMFAVRVGAGEFPIRKKTWPGYRKWLKAVYRTDIFGDDHRITGPAQENCQNSGKTGLIVDCTVPQGSRKADLDDQRQILQDMAKSILAKSGKTMDSAAFSELTDRTGFNPSLVAQNIDKLLAYTGSRTAITRADVTAIIQRDKKRPDFQPHQCVDGKKFQSVPVLSDFSAQRWVSSAADTKIF